MKHKIKDEKPGKLTDKEIFEIIRGKNKDFNVVFIAHGIGPKNRNRVIRGVNFPCMCSLCVSRMLLDFKILETELVWKELEKAGGKKDTKEEANSGVT